MCLQQCSPADASHQCMAVPQHSCTQMGRRRWPPPWGTFKLSFGYLWVQFFAWFSHVVLGLLQEAQHGIHMGISFPPCSAAVRAQHMESMFQKTSIFSRFFAICFSFLLSSIPWKYRFSLGKIDIFQVFAKNVLLQFATIFLLKNLSKTLPKSGLNSSKIDVENVSFFNIDFFASRPGFGRVWGL